MREYSNEKTFIGISVNKATHPSHLTFVYALYETWVKDDDGEVRKLIVTSDPIYEKDHPELAAMFAAVSIWQNEIQYLVERRRVNKAK